MNIKLKANFGYPPNDPLVLDLDGDGRELAPLTGVTGMPCDFDQDGFSRLRAGRFAISTAMAPRVQANSRVLASESLRRSRQQQMTITAMNGKPVTARPRESLIDRTWRFNGFAAGLTADSNELRSSKETGLIIYFAGMTMNTIKRNY